MYCLCPTRHLVCTPVSDTSPPLWSTPPHSLCRCQAALQCAPSFPSPSLLHTFGTRTLHPAACSCPVIPHLQSVFRLFLLLRKGARSVCINLGPGSSAACSHGSSLTFSSAPRVLPDFPQTRSTIPSTSSLVVAKSRPSPGFWLSWDSCACLTPARTHICHRLVLLPRVDRVLACFAIMPSHCTEAATPSLI